MIIRFVKGGYGLDITFLAGFVNALGFLKMTSSFFITLFAYYFTFIDTLSSYGLQEAKTTLIATFIWLIPASIAVYNAGKSSHKIWMILSSVVVTLYWASMAWYFYRTVVLGLVGVGAQRYLAIQCIISFNILH